MNAPLNPRAIAGDNAPPLAERLAIDEIEFVTAAQAIADRANQLPRTLAPETADADIAVIGELVRDAGALEKRIDARRAEVKRPWLDGQRTVDAFFSQHGQRMQRIVDGFTGVVTAYRAEQRRQERQRAAAEARKREAEEAQRRAELADAEAKGRERTAALAHEKAEAAAKAAEEAREREAQVAAPLPVQQVKATVGEGVTLKSKGEWTHRLIDVRKLDLEAIRPFLKGDHLEAAIRLAIRNGIREIGGVEIFQSEKVSFS